MDSERREEESGQNERIARPLWSKVGRSCGQAAHFVTDCLSNGAHRSGLDYCELDW